MKPQDLLPLIDPKINPKYSPNLHAWIKRNFGRRNDPIVVTKADSVGRVRVGRLDELTWLSGTDLNQVLCRGIKAQTWAIMLDGMKKDSAIDTTFWNRYIRDGRCAIDPEHKMYFIGDETRWRMHPNGSARECLWCGHHVQVKLDWVETVHKSEWVPA